MSPDLHSYGVWIKSFNNGSIEIGSDFLIAEGKASWSKGQLHNIKEVFLSEGINAVTLEISNTEWYQFDRYKAFLAEKQTYRISRYLQAKITKEHIGFYLCYNNEDIHLCWGCLRNRPIGTFCYKITSQDVDKWITVQLSLSNKPSIVLCKKGSIDGEQLFK